MRIPIKPLKQESRADCLSVCLRMILNYYGVTVTEQEIDNFFLKESTSFSLTGFLTDGSLFLRRKNLDVDCIGFNLQFTNETDSSLPWHELLKKLEDHQLTLTDTSYAQMLESTIRSIKYGTNHIIQKPNLETIYDYLKQDIPLIALINLSALRGEPGEDLYRTHAIVINGTKDNKLYIIDPLKGSEELVDAKDVLLAILATKWIVHPAYLLAIKEKKN